MRYNRANLDETMRAAQWVAARDGHTRFVYATAYGFTISMTSPPAIQRYYRISQGKIELCGRESPTP